MEVRFAESDTRKASPDESNTSLITRVYEGAKNNVVSPLVNSALIEPLNAASTALNLPTKMVSGYEPIGKIPLLKVEPARPYSDAWLAQTMSGGIGSIVPYTIAGRASGAAMRGVGARMELTGAAATLMKSEKLAFVAGAATYDGLRTPHEGETRLGNAMGGAAGFMVFGAGNDWAKRFTGGNRVLAQAGAGFVGADAHATVAKLVSQGSLPTFDEYMQAGVSGATMNLALPRVQDYTSRKITEFQARTKFGAPADLYLAHTQPEAIGKAPQLNSLLSENEWARVRVTDHAGFDAKRNVVDLSRVQETPGALAKGLEGLRQTRQAASESEFQQAASKLTEGNTAEAWNQFREARLKQELNSHQTENKVDSTLGLTERLAPEHMVQELGAWPAPGGVSQEYRWRQEFETFRASQGKWRPGERVTTEPFKPEAPEQTKSPVQDAELAALERVGTSLVTDLQKAGFLAVFAGGSVRDQVMGGRPKDYDIATRANPDQVMELFASKGYKVIPTGKQFGVINVIAEGKQYEIATLRNDGQYSDGRRPDQVRYVNSLYEDAARRDLTINAMFKEPSTGKIYDFHGGQADIQNKLIRTVGDPNQRFSEDYLRMMRVPRFASRYEGFSVEPTTLEAIRNRAPEIKSVSGERVREELKGIMTSKHPLTGLDIMMETGLMEHTLPEVAALTGPKAMQDPIWHPEGLTWTHTRMVVRNLTGSRWETMLAGLLHDIGKPATQTFWGEGRISNTGHAEVGAKMARDVTNRLKMSNAEKDITIPLIEEHMNLHKVYEWRRSRLMKLLGNPNVEEFIKLQHADSMGTGRTDGLEKSNMQWLRERQSEFANMQTEAQKIGAKPIVDGRMLIDMGLKSGKRLGDVKERALEAQQEGAFSDVDGARQWLKQMVDEFKPRK